MFRGKYLIKTFPWILFDLTAPQSLESILETRLSLIAENMNNDEQNIDFLKDCKEIFLGKDEYFVMSDNRV